MKHWLVALMMVFVGGAAAVSCAKGGTVDPSEVSTGAGGGTGATGSGGAGGTSTAQGSGGTTSGSGGSGGMNPCEGVLCDMPPPNECDGAGLKVYATVGTCDGGACTYGATTESCPNGCSGGACLGDPCLGVTCNTAPPPTCVDVSTLEVPQEPGTCNGGLCSYMSTLVNCPFGCDADQCEGDPCASVMCNQPAASYCFDADHLRVSDPPGVCDPQDGLCDYPTHDEYCAFGCANGACNNDPCIGVVCPAKVSYCSDANTVVQFDEGQCINGLPCTYASMAVNCPNGCVNGQCIACTVDAQCGSGKWCSGNQCLPCSEDLHCGATCIACGGATPKCNGVACVQCLTNAQCAAGNWCNGSSQCEACNTPQHCGPACAACGGQTPICGPSGCVECLNDVDCGAGEWCSAMTCQTCNTDQHCGASCVACGGATPHCNGASCVECLTAADCNVGEDCGPASTCIPAVGCVPPAAACTTGGTQDGGCANPYRISRNDAGTASGFTVNNTYGLCNRANNFTTGNCGGNTGSDAEYRLFMLKGETANITLTRGASTCTIGWAGTISLKIYEAACNADCTMCPQTCSTIDHCVQNNNQNTNFVAPSDGWYTIVVDSAGPVDDKGGVFYLNVKLTCSGGSCACQ